MYLRKTIMSTNCYLYFCPETGKGIIIDPEDNARDIMGWAAANHVEPERIVLTHGHIDHIGAVEELRKIYGLSVSIHKDDLAMLADPMLNLSFYFGRALSLDTDSVDVLEHGDIIPVGNLTAEVLHTPGHTPGGICLKTADGVFSGDTLFRSSVGRTDFPGGDMVALIDSINTWLMTMPDSVAVFPGHEGMTTIGYERMHNMFIS